MPTEAATFQVAVSSRSARAAALRLAFGVTCCFALVEALDWDATFLAPLLAAQLLVKLHRPPGLAQGLGLLVVIALATGIVLAVTAAFLGNPAVLIVALALLIHLSFYAHLRGAPELATLLLQISAVSLPVIAVASPEGAVGFAATLLSAGTVALLTVWVAHAGFPSPGEATLPSTAAIASRPAAPRTAARHALLDTLVLLPVLVWYVLDATEVAVVVMIVILTVLRQHEPGYGRRAAALGLVAGNLIGGITAALAYNLILVGDSFAIFVIVCMAASLMFAGRTATAGSRGAIYAIAFATFILLLGLGLSPLPGGSGEAFASRMLNVFLASIYAVGAVSILDHWRVERHESCPDGVMAG